MTPSAIATAAAKDKAASAFLAIGSQVPRND